MRDMLHNSRFTRMRYNLRNITYEFIREKCKTNPILSAVGGLQMNVSNFSKMAYENKHNWTLGENKPKQTQLKANTNPISEMPKMNLSTYQTRDYSNKTAIRRIHNKPNQTQFFNSFIRLPYTLRGPAMNLKSPAKKSGHTPETKRRIFILRNLYAVYNVIFTNTDRRRRYE